MKFKAFALLALAAAGLGIGTSFDAQASRTSDCLAFCRSEQIQCWNEGIHPRYCLQAFNACKRGC